MVKKRVITTAAALILFSIPQLYAQDGDDYSEDYGRSYGNVYTQVANFMSNANYATFSELSRNQCLSFLNDTTGRSNVKFKSVTETKYTSPDSLIEHKKLITKTVYHYNPHGQILSYILTDTIGKVKDSAVAFYDASFHNIQARSYSYNDVTNKLAIGFEVNNTYDSKGNCIKIEEKEYKKSYDEMNPGGYDTTNTLTYYTYDDKAKPVKTLTVANIQDTTIMNFTYDANGKFSTLTGVHHTHRSKELYDNPKLAFTSETYYIKMDGNGNMLRSVLVNGTDTGSNDYYTYDDQSRETSYLEYTKGKLVSKKTIIYGLEEARTKTEDEFGTTAGSYENYDDDDDDDGEGAAASPSCTTDTKTISVYNRYGKLESKTTTVTGTGKPSVTKILHNYIFNSFDKVESDSMTDEEQSEYHSSGTLTVYTHTYDTRGNRLEDVEKGGGGTAADNRTTYSWNEQNNLLTENEYGSCLDIPYSTYSYAYYADGATVKEYDMTRSKSTYVYKYGPITQKLESIYSSSYGVDQVVYEYENW